MKINRLPGWSALISSLLLLFLNACVTPATQMRHGGDFSNLRSEVFLADGSSFLAYASLERGSGQESLKVQIPGERHERSIPLSKVHKLKMEDHEFVVKIIQTPGAARKEGKPAQSRVVMKRMGMESDAVQVFEYKYEVRNPKSPMPNLHTTWYVSFPADDVQQPLVEFGTAGYRNKWNLLLQETKATMVVAKPPHNVKSLLDEVKKIPIEGETPAENVSAD